MFGRAHLEPEEILHLRFMPTSCWGARLLVEDGRLLPNENLLPN